MLLGVFVNHFYDFTVDDAYISFRYATNLAEGNGLVFNLGECVEGYTNFLWTALIGGLIYLGADPVPASKVLGIIFALITLALLLETSIRLLPGRGWLNKIPSLLLVTTPSFAIWTVSGLETIMFACLLLMTFRLILYEESSPHRFQWSWILLFILTLTRPEGLLFFALAVVVKFFPERDFKRLARWAAPYLILLAVYLAWKYWYFGNLLPNTFYAKTGRGLYQYLGGLFYTYSYFKNYGGVVVPVLVLLPLLTWGNLTGVKKKALSFLLLSFAGWVAYSVYKGHDPLPSFRFFVLILPITFLLIMQGLAVLQDAVRKLLQPSRPASVAAGLMTVAIVGLLVTQSMIVTYLSTASRTRMQEYQVHITGMDARHEFIPMGKALRRLAPPDAEIAVIDAGAIPYFSGLYTIDRWGLIDPHIARHGGGGNIGEKYDAAYILERKPAFIQTKMYRSFYNRLKEGSPVTMEDFDWPGDLHLFRDSSFTTDYHMSAEPVLDGFFVRNDLSWLSTGAGNADPNE